MGTFAWAMSPALGWCVKVKPWSGRCKRLDGIKVFYRYYLWDWLSWFQTFDNPIDEYYWGDYEDAKDISIGEYEESGWLRYKMRCKWLRRNAAYGFNLSVLGYTPKNATVIVTQWRQFKVTFWFEGNSKKAFQIQGNLFITKSLYLNINVGWKAHKQVQRLMFAGRLLQFPKKA